MPRRLLTSRSNRARLDAAVRWLQGREEGALVLAASQRAGQELLRTAATHTGGLLGARSTTVGQLAGELVLRGRTDVTPLPPLSLEGIACRTLARVVEERPLEFFGPVADTPGFLRALARTLEELRLQDVQPGGVLDLGPRGRDLARLLEALDDSLAAQGAGDRARVLEAASEVVAGGADLEPVGLPLLMLDLPVSSRRERRFVRELTRRAPDVLALGATRDPSVARLQDELGCVAEVLEEETASDSRLGRARVFVFGDPEGAGSGEEDGSLVFFSAPGEAAESVEIARRLLGLARAGVAFDRCAVLLREPATYQPVLEEALSRAGIPSYFSRGVHRPDPAGRAFLALLECAAEGLSASRFAEYLSFAQVPYPGADGGPADPEEVPWLAVDEEDALALLGDPAELVDLATEPVAGEEAPPESESSPVVAGTLRTPMHWERLLVEASVVGGLERWRRRLRGLEEELRARRDAATDEDPPRAQAFERQLERLQHLERFALPLVETLVDLPGEAPWGDWLQALERLAVRSLRDPARVLRVLAELRPMAAVGPVRLAEVRRTLSDRLRTLRATPGSRPQGRVFVGGLDDARGRSFHTVFVPGLAEGIFPRRLSEDPLLLDDQRLAVGGDLATRETRGLEERLLLELALGAAEEHLVSSYPTLDTLQGRPRVPSFYALDLVRAAEGRLPDQRALERAAHGQSSLLRGWPAPRSPEEAIDEAEYDLAVLEPLLREREASATGRGRFLLRASPILGRSLRARWWRWVGRAFGPWDGLVDPEGASREALRGQGLGERPYSPTALQGFAACPYRFHLHSLVGLRPRDEIGPLEELDPLTRGQIFHEAQARYLRALQAEELLPLLPDGAEEALDRLDRELDAVATAWEETLCPALPRVWASEMEALRQDLRGWVREMVAEGGEWTPRHFELAFGLPAGEERDTASVPDPVRVLDRVLLRGSIDLVEARGDGAIRVTDHKTGRAPDTERIAIGGGERLQPQLYSLAASAILDRPVHSGGLYFCTRRGGYRRYEVRFGEPFARHALESLLDLIGDWVEAGFLPAAPREGACRWCDYRMVCGPNEERRTRRKGRDRLEPLHALREEA